MDCQNLVSKTNHLAQNQVLGALFGLPKGGADPYRFGFNGQMKVNEMSGVGNHNTAEFWEYDTRLGRRWNLDPKPNSSWSSYSTFGNNPVLMNDILGDTTKVYNTQSDYLGTINDNHSNQIHFYENTFMSSITGAKVSSSIIEQVNSMAPEERDKWSSNMRGRSNAFMGAGSAKSLRDIAMKSANLGDYGKELGFRTEVSLFSREIIFKELYLPAGSSGTSTTFPIGTALNFYKSKGGDLNSLLGLGHTHIDGWLRRELYQTPFSQMSVEYTLDYYSKPTLPSKDGSRNDYSDKLGRRSPLFIGSPVGVTIYSHDKVDGHQPATNYKWFGNEKK